MKITTPLALLCLLAVSHCAPAQVTLAVPTNPATDPKNAPAPVAPGAVTPPFPTTPAAPQPPLSVTAAERQYFAFGYSLAKAAFSYAELAKRATKITKIKDKNKAVQELGNLLPIAERNREMAKGSFSDALTTMRALHAAPQATATISNAVQRLNKPLALVGEAHDVALQSPNAGRALASLNEFERLSGLSENATIKQWIASPAVPASGKVWYAEGLIAGLAEISAQEQMPDLLPPLSEITTDLRGMRDWLVLRFPDKPSAEQNDLKSRLNKFLVQAAPSSKSSRLMTLAELKQLGDICRDLRLQLLPDTAPKAPPPIAPPGVNAPPIATPA
ncbi:MAG: hypothetical protein ABIY70_13210 [Capsulimonas sp.]|uniref:hypothetical protein n=1 Tax=Capsulimonas sp. TaxID=2494211 RepID=UPI0032658076